MKARSAVALVACRELVERVRAKSFAISTGIFLLAAMAAVVVPHVVGDDEVTTYDVGVVGATSPSIGRALEAAAPAADARIQLRAQPDRAAADRALEDGSIDIALVDESRLVVKEEASNDLAFLLNRAVTVAKLSDRLREAGLDPAEVAAVSEAQPLPVDELEPSTPARDANRGLAMAGVVITYVMILSYGLVVANGVIEEKSSRVSELLLGAVRPHQLLEGKVVGIGLVAVVQLLAVGIPVGATALALGSLDVPEGTPLTFAAVFLWVVLGYALYSCSYAAAASTVTRSEEVANVTAPLNILIIVAYFVGFGAVAEPDSAVVRVLSFIPPFTPTTMLARAATGDVAPWEVPLAVALVLAFAYGLIRLGGRIYSGSILRRGPRVKLREAWRAS